MRTGGYRYDSGNLHIEVSRGIPKSSILDGDFHERNRPLLGTFILGNPHMENQHFYWILSIIELNGQRFTAMLTC